MSKEEKKAYHKAYYEAHKEEMKKSSSNSYYANRDENIRKRKEHYLQHREENLEKRKQYYRENKNKINTYNKEYNKLHKRAAKNTKLKLYYGITIEHYETMYSAQDGKCATCQTYYPSLVVDHDHKTGKVRKLLCSKCNLALGYVNDNPEILKNMIEYLSEL